MSARLTPKVAERNDIDAALEHWFPDPAGDSDEQAVEAVARACRAINADADNMVRRMWVMMAMAGRMPSHNPHIAGARHAQPRLGLDRAARRVVSPARTMPGSPPYGVIVMVVAACATAAWWLLPVAAVVAGVL